MRKSAVFFAFTLLFVSALSGLLWQSRALNAPEPQSTDIATRENFYSSLPRERIKSVAFDKNARGQLVGDISNAVTDFRQLYKLSLIYRRLHEGRYPANAQALFLDAIANTGKYGLRNSNEAVAMFTNPDTQYSEPGVTSDEAKILVKYEASDTRYDGTSVGSPKTDGTRDVLFWTGIYVQNPSHGNEASNPVGHYVVLWDNGEIQKVPYDLALYVPVTVTGRTFKTAFPNQAGVLSSSVDYEQFSSYFDKVPVGKPAPQNRDEPTLDNGGPEALVTFSRLQNTPDPYGIDRTELWKQFDPAQPEFTLDEVATGAAKLQLPLQRVKLTLAQLQARGGPVIFMTSDDKRLVTLASMDADHAVVLDQGLTRIVSRELLEKRYGGEVLLAGDANAKSSVQINDAVRVVPFASTDAEVTQTATITNAGTAPLTLQIERPIPGVTDAQLSQDTIAPGQSATLTLKLKWRTILRGETQNVFVTLKTNDAVQPRAQLGFQLQLAKTP